MAISSENLKLRMFHEITKQDTIHRNINHITWLISTGKPVAGEKHFLTVGSVHI